MGTEFLLLDDARRVYFYLDKIFVPTKARRQQSFDQFMSALNFGDVAPERSNRYRMSMEDGERLFDFCVSASWKVRNVGDCWDDPAPGYFDALRTYEAVDTIQRGIPKAACQKCGQVRLLLDDPLCAPCEWSE